MNIDDILDTTASNTDEIIVNGEMRGFLKETAKWAKFIAIVSFVGVGFMILGILLGGSALLMALGGGIGAEMGGIGGLAILFYLVVIAIIVFPLLYMYRFAVNTQKALAADDQLFLRDAFENLKSLFKFYGVFMAIGVGINLLVFLGSMLFGLAASF